MPHMLARKWPPLPTQNFTAIEMKNPGRFLHRGFNLRQFARGFTDGSHPNNGVIMGFRSVLRKRRVKCLSRFCRFSLSQRTGTKNRGNGEPIPTATLRPGIPRKR